MATMKPDADHIELSEPLFFQLDNELSISALLHKHRRALLICQIPSFFLENWT